MSQRKNNKMDENRIVTFRIGFKEANLIVQALAKMPFELVYELIPKLQGQWESQSKPEGMEKFGEEESIEQ
jgi:hypothetical protein